MVILQKLSEYVEQFLCKNCHKMRLIQYQLLSTLPAEITNDPTWSNNAKNI